MAPRIREVGAKLTYNCDGKKKWIDHISDIITINWLPNWLIFKKWSQKFQEKTGKSGQFQWIQHKPIDSHSQRCRRCRRSLWRNKIVIEKNEIISLISSLSNNNDLNVSSKMKNKMCDVLFSASSLLLCLLFYTWKRKYFSNYHSLAQSIWSGANFDENSIHFV